MLLNGRLLLHLHLLLLLLNLLKELLLLPLLIRLLKGSDLSRILFWLLLLTDELLDSCLLLGLEHLKLTSLSFGVAILWLSREFAWIREVVSSCF